MSADMFQLIEAPAGICFDMDHSIHLLEEVGGHTAPLPTSWKVKSYLHERRNYLYLWETKGRSPAISETPARLVARALSL